MPRPVATYRLQLRAEFTLADAERIVPALGRLGISHVYLSPIAEAMPGSTHGYDVIDPTRVAEALGGENALASLATTLHAHGMGALLDVVPNHMAASPEAQWWASLLEHGAESPHARIFDTPLAEDPTARLRLPVLGAPLEEIIEHGELTIGTHAGQPVVCYHENWFPIPARLHQAAHDALHDPAALRVLLAQLPYELGHWRCTMETVCYRRFFDVSALVGVRVEDPAVFTRTHAGIVHWLENGWIDALRIDHIDGLRDPASYLRELAAATAQARGGERCYTLVEKILAADEDLPTHWQADGATGYEFAGLLAGFFVDPAGYTRLDALRRTVTGESRDFEAFVHDAQRDILEMLFPAELTDVSARIAEVAGTPARPTRTAVRELTAALPVYRTYIDEDGVSARDRRVLETGRARAAAQLDDTARVALDTVVETLLFERATGDDDLRGRTLDAIARWQQLSGPAMAKGYEDTALYAWPALLAANDVGAEPEASLDAAALHAAFARRAARTPLALNAGSTHDAKRSEDVRARLLVLAEHAPAWTARFPAWLAHIAAVEDRIAPRDVIVLLQTVVGVWPLEGAPDVELASRVSAFMCKAAREAKQETSWHTPDAEYERALDDAVRYVLLAPEAASLRAELGGFVERIALHGAAISLCQLLLRCTAPGIPDVYQGNESWRFDLVDPDNRRPVDFAALAERSELLLPMVERPTPEGARALLGTWRDGRIKQYVLMASLAARARNRAFAGAYTPVNVVGDARDQVCSFLRFEDDAVALVVATRWPARAGSPDALLTGTHWQNERLEVPSAQDTWRCCFTGATLRAEAGTVSVAEALCVLPFALLEPA